MREARQGSWDAVPSNEHLCLWHGTGLVSLMTCHLTAKYSAAIWEQQYVLLDFFNLALTNICLHYLTLCTVLPPTIPLYVSANKSSGLLGHAEEQMQVVKPRLGCTVLALLLIYISGDYNRYMCANMGITKEAWNRKPWGMEEVKYTW